MTSEIFQKTLIVGASVSAAATDRNPVRRFLGQRGTLAGARTHALSGRPATVVLPQLKTAWLDQATTVIALDLLFWDSVIGLGEPREAIAYLRGFFKAVTSRNLPILIGRIPHFHALQVHRAELNDAIEKEVARHPRARVIELDRLFEQVTEDEGVHIDGKHHPLSDLIPDGLHPGPVAAEFIAREIDRVAKTLVSTQTEKRATDLGDFN